MLTKNNNKHISNEPKISLSDCIDNVYFSTSMQINITIYRWCYKKLFIMRIISEETQLSD